MKTKFYSTCLVLFVLTVFTSPVSAQVSGTVFRDINNDGVRQLSNPTEPGEYGVVVKGYNAVNTLIGTATTDANGNYSFSAAQAPAGIAVRIEFTVNSGDQPSKRMAANSSNVQFVVAGATATNKNFAIADKKWFTNDSNPYVATTAYTNGNPNSSGAGTAGDNNNLYVFPYDLSSDGGSTRRAKNQYLGAVFGLSWQRESRTLFTAAYLKRHAGFGPGGIGAIYQTQISKTGIPSTPALLLDVAALGINVGTDPRTTTLPALSSAVNTDNGVFAEVGKRGIGGMEISTDGRELYIVNMYEKKLQRINIGNPIKASFSASDVTGSWLIPDPALAGTTWHPMAVEMHNGKVYVGGVTAKETTTAHNNADTVNLRGIVYEFNPATAIFTKVLTFALSHRKGFTNTDFRYEDRNNYWSAWQNSGDISIGGPLRTGLLGALTGGNATGIYYSQPMLCNIEFDVDGSMILGIRDRFGDQAGYANLFESGNVSGETYRALASGEILRAGKSGSGWTIENNATVSTNGVTTSTPGLTDNAPLLTGSFLGLLGTPWGGSFGPGGGYYYYNQNFSMTGVPAPFNAGSGNTSHYGKSNGGLVVYPGYNEVMSTAIDPVSASYTNGILKNTNLGANAGNMSGRKELIVSAANDPTNMGKAAALGDMELLLDAEAMEIGNRVWDDANNNGIQDATETGIPNVTVVLRSPGADGIFNNGDDQTWTVITDAEGHYYFDATIVNDSRRPSSWLGVSDTNSGILPGFKYRVEIATTQTALSGYNVTGKNLTPDTAIDSDGSLSGTTVRYTVNPGGSTGANSEFSNDYNIDFGFYATLLPLRKIELTATLNDHLVKVNWNTKEEFDVNKYHVERSTDGVSFTEAAVLDSKGNGSFSYTLNDAINSIEAPAVYYRIHIVDITTQSRYTEMVKVNLAKDIQLQVVPNPFSDHLNLQLSNTKRTTAVVHIFNTAGQLVFGKTLTMDKGVSSISLDNLRNLTKGIYIIDVKTEEQYISRKLLKQ